MVLVYAALWLRGAGAGDTPAHPDIRAHTTLVQIPVTVMDAGDHPVMTLRKENFRIFEDGVEQPIDSVSAEDAPIAVCVLFDVSSSMRPKLALSRRALQLFVSTENEQDRYCLIEFNEHSRLRAGFPSLSQELLLRAEAVHAAGMTALLDAVCGGINEMRRVRAARKALLIISDGGDNRSRYTETEVLSAVREGGVQIYALGLLDAFYSRRRFPELARGPDLLYGIADETGGRAYLVEQRDQLAEAARRIGVELRNQYLVHYKPLNEDRDGRYRRVVVQVEPEVRNSRLRVSWRKGYYAPLD
jgi:VWFA-related protein